MMKRLPIIIATAWMTAAMATPVKAEKSDPQDLHFIQVSGTGRVSVAPDKADVSLSVEIQDKTAEAARNKAAKAMNSIIQAIRKQGIAEKDVQTRYVSLYPVYTPDTANRVAGYQLANQINVVVRDINKISPLIDAAVAAGGNAARVQGINFMVDKPESALAQAREKAFSDARTKALQYAKYANANLGQVMQIREDGNTTPMPVPYAAVGAMKMSSEMADATPVQAGEQEISVNVNVVFAIE